ncbi:hypothetical protein Tco_1546126 [Tanacetum coccineum]
MSYLSTSITARIIEQVKSQLPQILPKEVSNFALPAIKSIVTKSLEHAVLAKESSQPKECYDGLIKSYDLEKSLLLTYAKVYSLKRSRKDKDKDEDPSVASDRGKSVQSEEPDFEVADSDMLQNQEENLGNDNEEPKGKVASKRDWFTKHKRPQEPTDPDWNVGKTTQQGPTQS